MKPIAKIYTKAEGGCDWCVKAKAWLDEHNIAYVEHHLMKHEREALYEQLGLIASSRTVPQILHSVGNQDILVGGYQELIRYEPFTPVQLSTESPDTRRFNEDVDKLASELMLRIADARLMIGRFDSSEQEKRAMHLDHAQSLLAISRGFMRQAIEGR